MFWSLVVTSRPDALMRVGWCWNHEQPQWPPRSNFSFHKQRQGRFEKSSLTLPTPQGTSSTVAKPSKVKLPKHSSPFSHPQALAPAASSSCKAYNVQLVHPRNWYPPYLWYSQQMVCKLWNWMNKVILPNKQRWVSNPSLLPPDSVFVSWHQVAYIEYYREFGCSLSSLLECQSWNDQLIGLQEVCWCFIFFLL